MNIIIKATNIELTEALKEWARMRLGSLEKLMDFLEQKDTEVWVEIGRITKGQCTGEIFRAEAQIRLPAKSIRVEATTSNLKKSINEIKEKLQREIKEYKEKTRAHYEERRKTQEWNK